MHASGRVEWKWFGTLRPRLVIGVRSRPEPETGSEQEGGGACCHCSMASSSPQLIIFLLLACLCGMAASAAASDTLRQGESLSAPATLVSSPNGVFELGFFAPDTNRPGRLYLGIWFRTVTPRAYVWVANRATPATSPSPSLTLTESGDLLVLDGGATGPNGTALWSSNTSSQAATALRGAGYRAVLQDTGSLQVRGDEGTDLPLWDSFWHPTDTMLPGMEIAVHTPHGRDTSERMLFTSWASETNPAPGRYALGLDPNGSGQAYIWRDGKDIHWRCIHIALLCVQDLADERPDIPLAILMLSSDNSSLPKPGPPTLMLRGREIEMSRNITIATHFPNPRWSWAGLSRGRATAAVVEIAVIPTGRRVRRAFRPAPSRAMAAAVRSPLAPLLLLLLFIFFSSPTIAAAGASDTISVNASLADGETLVSAGEVFELGFFTAASSGATFLGIWYMNITPQTVVWVANRNSPIPTGGATASLAINATGALVLSNPSGRVFWSLSNASTTGGAPVAQLLDSGNFVLSAGGAVLWQSFDDPSDTLLPGMKLGWDLTTGLDRHLTTWQSSGDPSPGDYTFGIDIRGVPEGFIRYNGTMPVYRNGPWNGLQFSGEPEMEPNNSNFRFEFISNATDVYYTFVVDNSGDGVVSRLVVNQSSLQRYVWPPGSQAWSLYWSLPRDQCDAYAKCGAFGVCDTTGGSPACGCVHGFSPASPRDWALRDSSGGCKRDTPLNCTGGDGFLRLEGVKLPDTTNATEDAAITVEQCRQRCLANCSCLAFSASNIKGGDSGCIIWSSLLIDIRHFASGGQDLYVHGSRKKNIVVAVFTVAVKRLSKFSTQGLDEFKNEVMLIAKLQHVNLVRLLGCCIHGEERILLNWSKRFDIILGIARGLLYLHQDSRYKVIHRDLKAGNILLDKDMNPKISDFGVARIFGDDTDSHTRKVLSVPDAMACSGYMSPEYAMDGVFSVKSDVFSFGVLVLEIVSGRKNRGMYSGEQTSLLSHAWKLWREGNAVALLDEAVAGGDHRGAEVLRCVQERPDDRPHMAAVLLALGNPGAALPQPRHPGFCTDRGSTSTDGEWSSTCTVNDAGDATWRLPRLLSRAA
ncbi:hypothetical protein HU200_051543 [Digitaria exilis]|uniref:non-specific serine/threonine protein kinase n=1 Tax=Digitaria exilis TaxID=1010633 RepID=A0A835AME4_9POAL|nr:hypothetical protein HU200_051543 [Digitaria exilis]